MSDATPDQIDLSAKGSVVAAGTALSRVTGLVRDIFLSAFLGATAAADAFHLAFRIPNFFRRLLAEGAFAQAFVPVLSEYREKGTLASAQQFVRVMSGNFAGFLVVVCGLGSSGAALLVLLFTLGAWQSDMRFELATDLAQIMFPYLGFMALTAFAASVLNSYDRYAVPAFTPVLLNVVLVLSVLAAPLHPEPIFMLAWGVLAAGFAQLLLQFPSLFRTRFLVVPRVDFKHAGVRKVLLLLGPAVLAASASQINVLVGTILASQLVVGSVSWIYFAERFLALPIGTVAIALRTVILPSLSRIYQSNSINDFSSTLDWGTRLGLLLGLPAAVGLYFLAEPIIATIYHRGVFEAADIWMSAAAVRAYSVGVLPMVLILIAAPGFFARQNTKTPLKYALISVAANVCACLGLFWWLGHVGIAFGTSVASILQCYLLYRRLLGDGVYRPSRALFRAAVACLAGSAVMALTLVQLSPDAALWASLDEMERILRLACLVGVGLMVYLLVLFMLGVRPRHVLHRV
ncbi:MAG: murein biosynthesis integral membrane protein MurJ [Pseudomonadales bacterium]|nr:murein biosynthesis integral membrane protein MurJ [Pseudomonadales bacterium]